MCIGPVPFMCCEYASTRVSVLVLGVAIVGLPGQNNTVINTVSSVVVSFC